MGERFDVVVVGSGIAGLCAALHASAHGRVGLITKGGIDDGCSRWAQGGIAAAVGPDDSPEHHLADTIAAGGGLCDERVARVLVEEAPARIRELIEWGVGFDSDSGVLLTGWEAAHTRARIVHARGDATGLEIESRLVERVRAAQITVFEDHHVTRLLNSDGRCAGVDAVETMAGGSRRLIAGAVILASGGAGRLWSHTTNPASATGDGVALGYDAGAAVAGMEFMQFHPTALALEGAPRFLISEAIRGEGAQIVNAGGERFLFDADPRGEMAGRDVVAHAIWSELQRSGHAWVYLDCRPLAGLVADRFPTIHRTCLRLGIDLTRDLVPIAPAAHYLVGGVRTDIDGATSVPGLYACGEVASTGVHGANRLASNSLLESVVFAPRAARSALDCALLAPPCSGVGPGRSTPGERPGTAEFFGPLRDAMWAGAGVVRDRAGLIEAGAAADRVLGYATGDQLTAVRQRQAATCARLVCDAALAREESRGCHLRSDFPRVSDNWKGLWVLSRDTGAHFDSHA